MDNTSIFKHPPVGVLADIIAAFILFKRSLGCIYKTEEGVLYKMQQKSPHKNFIVAPTSGTGATCKSCAICPWMKMNTVSGIEECLIAGKEEVLVPEKIIKKALVPIQRMFEFCEDDSSDLKRSEGT